MCLEYLHMLQGVFASIPLVWICEDSPASEPALLSSYVNTMVSLTLSWQRHSSIHQRKAEVHSLLTSLQLRSISASVVHSQV